MNKINYGFDASAIMRNMIIFGATLIFLGLLIPYFFDSTVLKYISYVIILVAVVLLILGTSMYVYGIKGKFKMRDFVLSKIDWKGNENVLDIGTGLGVYMIGAAKKLTTGKSIGIDIWRAEDLSNNTMENAYKNAELENVRNKVEILNEDACKLSFANNTFDVILSMYCIHNIEDKKSRNELVMKLQEY